MKTDFGFARFTQVWIASAVLCFFPITLMAFLEFMVGKQSIFVTSFDWGIMTFYVLAGLLLVFQRKVFWFLAIVILFTAACLEFYHSSNLASATKPFDYQFTLASATIIVIAYIFYFFRFPYLDGRDTGLFGVAHRYEVDMPAKISTGIVGKVSNASMSGVLFKGKIDIEKYNFADKLKISIADLELKDVPVEVRGVDSETLRLKFLWLKFSQFRGLQQKLIKYKKQDRTLQVRSLEGN